MENVALLHNPVLDSCTLIPTDLTDILGYKEPSPSHLEPSPSPAFISWVAGETRAPNTGQLPWEGGY